VVTIRYRSTDRRYVVNLVGTSIHVAPAPETAPPGNHLVAIGMHLDVDDVRARLRAALAGAVGTAGSSGIRRLQRYRRLSI
jgi:Cobalamin synthesis protein cobW C-terminal domain